MCPERTGQPWRRKQSPANQSPRQDSLLTGKNTGNFSVSARSAQFDRKSASGNQRLTTEFPVNQNREFDLGLQGISGHEQRIYP